MFDWLISTQVAIKLKHPDTLTSRWHVALSNSLILHNAFGIHTAAEDYWVVVLKMERWLTS